jgi:hypothetical protein
MSSAQLVISRAIQNGARSGSDGRGLSAAEVAALRVAQAQDMQDFWYSGLLTLGEAIWSLDKKQFSWATAKFYYSTFYFCRAILSAHSISIEFCQIPKPTGTKSSDGHFAWRSMQQARGQKTGRNTHDSVLKYFETNSVVNRLTGQTIGQSLDQIPSWLSKQRNAANYTRSRFADPEPTECMKILSRTSARKALTLYLDDPQLTYAFDSDHAIFAYPVELAKELSTLSSLSTNSDELALLKRCLSDDSGPFSNLHRLFSS